MPNTPKGGGISRKIFNPGERKKIRSILNEIIIPKEMGLIVRTAGANKTKNEINNDLTSLIKNWETIKEKEKIRESRLDGIPIALPSLLKAQRVQQKASYVGFDWDNKDEVWEKVFEEIQELRKAEALGNKDLVEEEMGDLIFTLVNLCRFLDISSDNSLRKSINKFTMRFKYLEKVIKQQNRKLDDVDFSELNEIWEQGKKILK